MQSDGSVALHTRSLKYGLVGDGGCGLFRLVQQGGGEVLQAAGSGYANSAHICVSGHMHVCAHMHICARMHVCAHACKHSRILLHVQARARGCVHRMIGTWRSELEEQRHPGL